MEERELTWRRSTRSGGDGNDNCVEIAVAPGRVLVRDSKDPRGPVLRVSAAEWREFLTDLRA